MPLDMYTYVYCQFRLGCTFNHNSFVGTMFCTANTDCVSVATVLFMLDVRQLNVY